MNIPSYVPKFAYHVGATLLDISFAKNALKFVQTSTRVFGNMKDSRAAGIANELWNQKFMHLMGALSFGKSALDFCKNLHFYTYYKKDINMLLKTTYELNKWELANDVVNLVNSSTDLFSFTKHFLQPGSYSRIGSALDFVTGPSIAAISLFSWIKTQDAYDIAEMEGSKNPFFLNNSSWYINQAKNALGIVSGVMLTVKWVKDIKTPGFGRILDIITLANIALTFISKVDSAYRKDAKVW